jgi:hypothetical protein
MVAKLQAPVPDPFRHGHVIILKQLMQIAQRHAIGRSDHVKAEICIANISLDPDFDRSPAGGADRAVLARQVSFA